MLHYTQEQIDRANETDLAAFLRSQGEELTRSGREYRLKAHDSLTIRGNKWFWHSRGKGGYPVDFVMEVYGKSFAEAMRMLTGEARGGQIVSPLAVTTPPPKFHLPPTARTNENAIRYLCDTRRLDRKLVEAFFISGNIYEEAKHHNVVFVGRDKGGLPRYAHLRGTAGNFRQDVAGSDKSCGFRYEGTGNQLFVFEAPIDLLSFICLFPKDWQTRSYLSLGGVSGRALDSFLSERKDIERIFLCPDSDETGAEAAARLAVTVNEKFTVIRLVPALKDWNEVLCHRDEFPDRKYIADIIAMRKQPDREREQPMPVRKPKKRDAWER